MRFYIIILLSVCSFLLKAQVSHEESVRAMFENEEKIMWVKHYKGRLDDMNDIAITLGFDGEFLRGEMIYLRSKAHFFLVGELKNDEVFLQEYDGNSLVTGYIKGAVNENKIEGEWQNYDNTLGASIEIKEVTSNEIKLLEVPTYCGDNKWVRFYDGKVGKEEASLILQRTGGKKITGTLVVKGEAPQRVDGSFDHSDNLNLSIINEMLKTNGRLKGVFDSKNNFNAKLINSKKKEFVCTFVLDQNLPLGGVEYADYMSSYDVLYPKVRNDAFTVWMDAIVNGWMRNCKKYVEKAAMRENPQPSTRYSVRAHSWTEIDIADKDLISGQFRFMSTWEDRPISRNLNFDLRNDREILAEDIFIDDFNYRKYVKKYFVNRLLQHEWAEDNTYREWLDQQEFSTFNFRADGMYFSTDYSPVFGRQEITIPYKKLRYFFKKHPIIEKCMKGKF